MGVEDVFVLAQVIPAHRLSAQVGGAIVFILLLLAVGALFRRVSRQAVLEDAEAAIEERWAELEEKSGEQGGSAKSPSPLRGEHL